MDNFIFFDSHGSAWTTCSADDRGAEAFGPRGVAKRIEWYSLQPPAGGTGKVFDPAAIPAPVAQGCDQTAYVAALARGAVEHGEDGDWPTLKTGWWATGNGRWLLDSERHKVV